MQNGPVTLYWRREYFAEDIGVLRQRSFVVPLFDCRAWPDEFALHEELRVGLGMRTTPATASMRSTIRCPRSTCRRSRA